MKYLIIFGLASLFFTVHPAVVQGQEVTASEVVDRETLKAFVEGAKDSLESASNFAEVSRLVEIFRSEGDWKAGSMYLVILTIYNVLGQEVRLLVQQFQSAGNYTVVWDGRDAAGRQVSTGMYVYRLQAGADVVTRKMLLAK